VFVLLQELFRNELYFEVDIFRVGQVVIEVEVIYVDASSSCFGGGDVFVNKVFDSDELLTCLQGMW
jgi:hypothetical protein